MHEKRWVGQRKLIRWGKRGLMEMSGIVPKGENKGCKSNILYKISCIKYHVKKYLVFTYRTPTRSGSGGGGGR